MSVQLSVADVRAALSRVAGPNAGGPGEPSTLLLGRLFHEVFADLVSTDPLRSGLKIVVESGADRKRAGEQLLDHCWHRLLAPRLRRNAAVLQSSSAQVLMLWKATQNLTTWLAHVVDELLEHRPAMRGAWEQLEQALQAEVPLTCELMEPGWTESVKLSGFADSVLRVPDRDSFCAVELKLGRAAPVVDLGQAALYHLILTRSVPTAPRSALALMRFSPDLEEHLIEFGTLTSATERLLNLIGRLAGVLQDNDDVLLKRWLYAFSLIDGGVKPDVPADTIRPPMAFALLSLVHYRRLRDVELPRTAGVLSLACAGDAVGATALAIRRLNANFDPLPMAEVVEPTNRMRRVAAALVTVQPLKPGAEREARGWWRK